MSTKPQDATFAFGQFADQNGNLYGGETGLTKREYFAAMAMQGIMSNEAMTMVRDKDKDLYEHARTIAALAVTMAENLIDALNNPK